jgi:hypothetical protein
MALWSRMVTRKKTYLFVVLALLNFAGLKTQTYAQECAATPGSAAAKSSSNSPNRLALLVGVGDYLSPTIRKLFGPPNDVAQMKAVLTDKFEFPAENVITLVDAAATRQGILDALCNHLIAGARAGDVVVFYFSGHGSRVADREPLDESDGYDETLVPYDARQGGIGEIRDDEIQQFLDRLLTGNVTVILDSCHSGTGAKASAIPRGIDPEPSEVEAAARLTAGNLPGARSITLSSGFRPNGARHVVIAGSRADQLSYEFSFPEGSHGALTYFLVKALRIAGPDTTYRDVLERTAYLVTGKFPSQTPQLEGPNQDNLLFQGVSALTSQYVPAVPDVSGDVRLQAGAASAVTVGSTYDVHPPGTRDFTKAPLAHIEVVEVRAFDAIAKVLSGGPVRESASRAVEVVHVSPGRRMQVFAERDGAGIIDDAFLKELRSALSTSRRDVDFVSAIETADLIMALPPLFESADRRRREIAFHFPDGTQASAGIAHDKAGAAVELATQLAQWAHWFGVMNLTNAQPRLKALVELRSQGNSGPPDASANATAGSNFVIKHGTKFELRVRNSHTAPLFVHVIGLFPNGGIAALWPPRGAKEQIAPGGEWTDTYDADTQGADRVVDILKVFLSATPIDISLLERPGMKSRAAMTDLETLLADAAEGQRFVGRASTGDWITFEKLITVVR